MNTLRSIRAGPPWVLRAVLLACVAVVWELAVDAGLLMRTVIAPPSQIARAAWALSGEAELIANLARTLGEVLASVGLAILIGVSLGLLLWRVPALFRIVGPFLSALYAVPLIFLYPVLLAWFGLVVYHCDFDGM